VRIGDGAIIAPNSLVISDVPAGATAMGVPARIFPETGGDTEFRKGSELDVARAIR
jgi:serine acetyltransferase